MLALPILQQLENAINLAFKNSNKPANYQKLVGVTFDIELELNKLIDIEQLQEFKKVRCLFAPDSIVLTVDTRKPAAIVIKGSITELAKWAMGSDENSTVAAVVTGKIANLSAIQEFVQSLEVDWKLVFEDIFGAKIVGALNFALNKFKR